MFCVEWESARKGGAKISVKIFDCNHLCAGVLVLDKDPLGLKVLERYVLVSNSEIKAEKEQLDHDAAILIVLVDLDVHK